MVGCGGGVALLYSILHGGVWGWSGTPILYTPWWGVGVEYNAFSIIWGTPHQPNYLRSLLLVVEVIICCNRGSILLYFDAKCGHCVHNGKIHIVYLFFLMSVVRSWWPAIWLRIVVVRYATVAPVLCELRLKCLVTGVSLLCRYQRDVPWIGWGSFVFFHRHIAFYNGCIPGNQWDCWFGN